MNNILVMVHSSSSEDTLRLILKKTNIISLKTKDEDEMPSSQSLIERLDEKFADSNFKAKKINVVIVESNYDFFGQDVINKALFDKVLMLFPKADIFAFSRSTPGALAMALNYNDRIYALSTVNVVLSKLKLDYESRVIDVNQLKVKMLRKSSKAKRTLSMPEISDEYYADNASDVSRSSSLPEPITYQYGHDSEQSTSINDAISKIETLNLGSSIKP